MVKNISALQVALFTRAWIEINENIMTCDYRVVALFTRAWIEIVAKIGKDFGTKVALFTRAWIEIGIRTHTKND